MQQRPRLGAPQQATTRETRKCLNAGLARAAACEPLTSASADLRSTPAALELPCNLLLSMDRAPSPADSPLPLPPFCNLQHLEPEENDYSLHSVALLLAATTLMIFIKKDRVSHQSRVCILHNKGVVCNMQRHFFDKDWK